MTAGVITAAGTLVWRETNKGKNLEVLLIHRARYDDWSWPKGKPEPEEPLQVTAVRETAEETGLPVVLGQPLGIVRYKVNSGARKRVLYWSAQVTEDEDLIRARGGMPAKDDEADELRWVPVKEARSLLTYAYDREPLGQLVDQWNDSRLATWTVQLLRHARARKRSAFKGGEADRPLTTGGAHQAEGLTDIMLAYGIKRIISSPWERCAATVRPYAERTTFDVEGLDALTEAAHDKRKGPVKKLVAREMAIADDPTVICTHRPVLPTVFAALTDRTPHRLMNKIPDSDPYLKTAESLVVHLSPRPKRGAVVVAIDRVRSH